MVDMPTVPQHARRAPRGTRVRVSVSARGKVWVGVCVTLLNGSSDQSTSMLTLRSCLLLLALVVACVLAASPEKDGDVYVLTKDNFDDFVAGDVCIFFFFFFSFLCLISYFFFFFNFFILIHFFLLYHYCFVFSITKTILSDFTCWVLCTMVWTLQKLGPRLDIPPTTIND